MCILSFRDKLLVEFVQRCLRMCQVNKIIMYKSFLTAECCSYLNSDKLHSVTSGWVCSLPLALPGMEPS